MNKIIYFAVLFILMNVSSNVFADSFIIKLNFLNGEKSEDSWTSETTVLIDGSQIKYTKSWSGSAKGRDKDIDKQCNLTDEQVSAIQKIITDNNLLVKEAAEDKDEKYKSFERFVNISLDISFAEALGKIRINGDMVQIKYLDLYKRTMKLINLIDDYANRC